LLSAMGMAQKKSWTEWDQKDVERMLNNSAWGQTQSGPVTFHVRLFSARPIREALARNVLLKNPNLKPEQMAPFIQGEAAKDFIIIAVTAEASDRRVAGPILQKFATATTETLKDIIYLEGPDGKHVALKEYAAPTSDGTGAKFIFDRAADGKPHFSQSDSLKFAAELGNGVKLSSKFKLSDMNYDGKLEY